MSRKNSFHYMVFLDATGAAEVSGEDLLSIFDEDRTAFLMDYTNPRTDFAGRITAKVLGTAEIDSAVRAFEMFRGNLSFPFGYEGNLRAAAARGQSPNDYEVEVKGEFGESGTPTH
ncbi:MAG: hypothetical protein IMZ65_00080 [Planctomycetes bacterium]|nr:hypothetical protein [Planctomycetota bacterium]